MIKFVHIDLSDDNCYTVRVEHTDGTFGQTQGITTIDSAIGKANRLVELYQSMDEPNPTPGYVIRKDNRGKG